MKKSFRLLVAVVALCVAATAMSITRIAVLSDVHVTPGNACDSMLRIAVSEINADPSIDVVVLNGDLSNEGSDRELLHVKSIMDGVTAHPLFVLPGNHECTWSQSAVKTFSDIWGNDRFVTELGDSLVLIGINCGPYMKMADGHIKQEDLHWLRAELDIRLTPGKRVLNFNHYPLQADLDNWVDYVNLLEHYPVIGHINGHYHHVKQYRGGSIDAMMVRALQMKDDGFGYSFVDITPDSVLVYDKRIGESPRRVGAWKIETDHPISVLDEPLPTEYPAGITKVWADSASVFTAPLYLDGKVYFGNSLGHAKCVDVATGRQLWSRATGASLYAAPAVMNGGVAFPAHNAIKVYDPVAGHEVAEKTSTEGPYVADGLNDGNRLYQGGYKRIECYGADGDLCWTYDSIFNYCQGRPALSPDGSRLLFGAWDTNLRCLDPETGRLLWVWNNGRNQNMLGPGNVVPVVGDSIVIIVAPDRFMTALDLRTGRELWRDKSVRYRESLGAGRNPATGRVDRAYAKTMDGELIAVALEPEYRRLWLTDMGIGYDHAPCPILEHNGVIYVGSRRGIVTAVDANSHQVLWSTQLGRSEVNGFTLGDGAVYVTLTEGTIFAIPV